MKTKQESPKTNRFEDITNTIIQRLEQGSAPWIKPWREGTGLGCNLIPENFLTGKRYSGFNVLWLWMSGADSNKFSTFLQFKEAGLSLRKGCHGIPIARVETKTIKEMDASTGEEKVTDQWKYIRWHSVFALEDTDFEFPTIDDQLQGDPQARSHMFEQFLRSIPAEVHVLGNVANYKPGKDAITVPAMEQFESPSAWYATVAHEMAHWTGSESKLNRLKGKAFGDEDYAYEEMVAELASAYLCAEYYLPGKLQHAEYIGHWAKILKKDSKIIFSVAADAQRAVDYLNTRSPRKITNQGRILP